MQRIATRRNGRARSATPAVRFLLTREGRATIRKLVHSAGRSLGVRVDHRLYERALGAPRTPARRRGARGIDGLRRGVRRARALWTLAPPRPRVVVFADIERLSWADRTRAAALWDRLAASRRVLRLVNHPTRSLCRYELLRTLRSAGLNDFGVYRVSEGRTPRCYPVFLRGEDDHDGAISPLIHSAEELAGQLEARRAQGHLREGTLIVEFCDTSDEAGLFRKYGALRVGRHILPRHVFISRRWMLKSTTDSGGVSQEEMARIESDYVRDNPHAEILMDRFERAGIEYGRIDYGIKDGRVQVWEINTNPTIFLPQHFEDPIRASLHVAFRARLGQALAELARP